MTTKEYDITPVPKPRQTRSDKWKKRPAVVRYREFADMARALRIEIPESGAQVIFYLPMPKSWSAKKKLAMDGKPHQQRPDIDNLLKAILDVIYEEDSVVWDIHATKLWGVSGKIVVV